MRETMQMKEKGLDYFIKELSNINYNDINILKDKIEKLTKEYTVTQDCLFGVKLLKVTKSGKLSSKKYYKINFMDFSISEIIKKDGDYYSEIIFKVNF